MPTYDYRCTACDERFEVTRAMGSTAEECCPSCGAPAKRLFHPVGVAFKGTGFHNTDYKPRSKESEGGGCPASTGDGCSGCPAKE